jgi:hypothetical protein
MSAYTPFPPSAFVLRISRDLRVLWKLQLIRCVAAVYSIRIRPRRRHSEELMSA